MSREKNKESTALKRGSKKRAKNFLMVGAFLLISQHFNLINMTSIPGVLAQIHSVSNVATDLKNKDGGLVETNPDNEQEIVTLETNLELPKSNLEIESAHETSELTKDESNLGANIELPKPNLEDENAHEPPEVENALSQDESNIEDGNDLEQSLTNLIEEEEITNETEAVLEERNPFAQSEVQVKNWEEFKAAYNDKNVTKITLIDDIYSTDVVKLTDRRTSIEIDGQGHTLALKRTQCLPVHAPANGETPEFHLHDLHLGAINGLAGTGVDAEGSWSFIAGDGILSERTRNWKFRLGNITNHPHVARVLRAYQAEITLYGTIDLNTTAENFYTGSMIIEDGTIYKGNVSHYNYSVIWYVENSDGSVTNTGFKEEFKVGKKAIVQLTQTQTSGSSYPAVYHHWSKFTVEEDANLDISMPGQAIGYSQDKSIVTIKKDAYVKLTGQKKNSVIAFHSIVNTPNNSSFVLEPGAHLYVSGNVDGEGSGVIDMSTGKNHTFTLNSPASYDIRNNGTGNAVAFGTNSTFSIINSDINLWKTGSNLSNSADLSYEKVSDFKVQGNSAATSQTTTSTDPNLQEKFGSVRNYRRITGLNAAPIVEIEDAITDADYTIRFRVRLGYVKTDTKDANGKVIYEPLYAAPGQATVTLTDSYGNVYKDIPIENDGYAKFTDNKFQLAGKEILATAARGSWIQETPTSKKVLDVTPPEIATVALSYIDEDTLEITGTASEIGVKVMITVDGTYLQDLDGNPLTNLVDAHGKWSITLPESLIVGQKVQILLNDGNGPLSKEELIDIPATNNAVGNENPAEELTYRDATFPPGPIFTVGTYKGKLTLIAPESMSFGKDIQISSQDQHYPISDLVFLGVTDTRSERSPWSLKVQLEEEFKNETYESVLPLIYKKGGQPYTISTDAVEIYSQTNTDDSEFDISSTWYGPSEDGLYIEAKAGMVRAGSYKGAIKWILADVPGNSE